MKPKNPSTAELTQFQLFQARLDSQLNADHPLYQLANIIQWQRFDEAYESFYCAMLSSRATVHPLCQLDSWSDSNIKKDGRRQLADDSRFHY